MVYTGGTIRFDSEKDQDVLRKILGYASTYGSTGVCPKLSDGHVGLSLKNGHHITFIKGKPTSKADTVALSEKFNRRSRHPHIDFEFKNFNVRVKVVFQTYKYQTTISGALKGDAPTAHFKLLLTGSKLSEETDLVTPQSSKKQKFSICISDEFQREGSFYRVSDINPHLGTVRCELIGTQGAQYNNDLESPNAYT